ncbi:MAG TPA: type II secretion system protein N, partial [Gammaproteobacteria bacterium]|nr:type II secretion system protein N [Gammaproteobacteria bacterium]
MRLRSAWLWLGAGAYLVATIALFPAATAYRWFAPPEVRAAGLEGTIWRGRAALVSVVGLGASDVEWTTAFAPVLIGRIEVAVQARQPDGFVSTNVVAGLRSIRLLDLRATTTLSTLGRLVPLGDVRGSISAQLSELELRDGWPEKALGQVRIAGL